MLGRALAHSGLWSMSCGLCAAMTTLLYGIRGILWSIMTDFRCVQASFGLQCSISLASKHRSEMSLIPSVAPSTRHQLLPWYTSWHYSCPSSLPRDFTLRHSAPHDQKTCEGGKSGEQRLRWPSSFYVLRCIDTVDSTPRSKVYETFLYREYQTMSAVSLSTYLYAKPCQRSLITADDTQSFSY
jgi:hypothetical protein